MARLSVIIPTRNRGERLARAVRSAQHQTEADLEIIVVDDGSDDDTPARIERLAAGDRRVRGVRLGGDPDAAGGPGAPTVGVGAAAARNAGLVEAGGEVVAFLDDDDWWWPEKARRQLDALDADPTLAAVTSDYQIVDERGGHPRRHAGPRRSSAADLLWCNFVGGASVVMVRRSAFAELPAFDTSLVTCEDWDFHLRCASASPVAAVPATLCTYTLHGGARLSDPELIITGRKSWLNRHRPSMTPDCVDYHHARMLLMEAPGTAARMVLAAGLATSLSPRVSRILATESAAGRVGRLVGDPALSMRALHRLIAGA